VGCRSRKKNLTKLKEGFINLVERSCGRQKSELSFLNLYQSGPLPPYLQGIIIFKGHKNAPIKNLVKSYTNYLLPKYIACENH
jgi:hypothetical protein